MTTTTVNRIAALRALADHAEAHELGTADITSIQFEDSFTWPGLLVHLHTKETTADWVRSLGAVEARAYWHGGSVHVRITAAMDEVPVRLLYIATPSDRAVVAAFRDTLETMSGHNGGSPVELPAVLGGAA